MPLSSVCKPVPNISRYASFAVRKEPCKVSDLSRNATVRHVDADLARRRHTDHVVRIVRHVEVDAFASAPVPAPGEAAVPISLSVPEVIPFSFHVF